MLSRQSSLSSKSPSGKKSGGNNNVIVAVRIRPPNEKEVGENAVRVKGIENEVCELDERGDVTKKWTYEYVFGPSCSNQYIFDALGRTIVNAALEGYNSVLFMYGQTSSGKTFTLFGGRGHLGLVQLAMQEVYNNVMNSADTEYVIKFTFAELYNEKLKDLLADNNNDLDIYTHPQLGPCIKGITERNFTSLEYVDKLLAEGDARRHFGVTNMNAHSSRSHVMVRLAIEARNIGKKPENPLRDSWGNDKPHTYSVLNLVDLAGSERADKAGTQGDSLVEGAAINTSLLVLGKVIAALSTGNKKAHIPYRDGILTRLLSSALGGNAKTCVITCVSPAGINLNETQGTLRFAQRAKTVVNSAKKNEVDDPQTMIMKLTAELDNLKKQMEEGRFEDNENYKNQALLASKKYRNFKYLFHNTYRVITALKKENKHELAKRVREEARQALYGNLPIDDIIEEHSALIEKSLPREEKLNHRFSVLRRANSTGSMMMDGDDEEERLLFDGQEPEDSKMIIDLFVEEVREDAESARMNLEDIIIKYGRRIDKLSQQVKELTAQEKSQRHSCEDLSKMLTEKQIELKNSKTNETILKQKLDKLNKKLEEDIHHHSSSTDSLTKLVNNLKTSLDEKESQIGNLQHSMLLKEQELEKARLANGELQKDLDIANKMRKSFEDEAQRVKNELRVQEERMRGNMRNMLQQGSEQSKLLEYQNQSLHAEKLALRDENDALRMSKQIIDQEIAVLRRELKDLQEDLKGQLDENNALRSQIDKSHVTIQSLRSELAQAQAQNLVIEQAYNSQKTKFSEERVQFQEDSERLKGEMALLQGEMSTKVTELESQLASCQQELSKRQELIENKTLTMQQLEQQGNIANIRMESKIATYEETIHHLKQENSVLHSNYRDKMTRLMTENGDLKLKIENFESTMVSVNKFIRIQEEATAASQQMMLREYSDDSFDEADDNSLGGRRNSFLSDDLSDVDTGYFSRREQQASSPLVLTTSSPPPSLSQRVHKSTLLQKFIRKGGNHVHAQQQKLSEFRMANKCQPKYEFMRLSLKVSKDIVAFLTSDLNKLTQLTINLCTELQSQLDSTSIEANRRKYELDSFYDNKSILLERCTQLEEKVSQCEEYIHKLEEELLLSNEKVRSLSIAEECAHQSKIQCEYENRTLKSQMEKIRLDNEGYVTTFTKLNSQIDVLKQQLENVQAENIMLKNEVDRLNMRNKLIVVERDELVRQFIDSNAYYEVDENGLETLKTPEKTGIDDDLLSSSAYLSSGSKRYGVKTRQLPPPSHHLENGDIAVNSNDRRRERGSSYRRSYVSNKVLLDLSPSDTMTSSELDASITSSGLHEHMPAPEQKVETKRIEMPLRYDMKQAAKNSSFDVSQHSKSNLETNNKKELSSRYITLNDRMAILRNEMSKSQVESKSSPSYDIFSSSPTHSSTQQFSSSLTSKRFELSNNHSTNQSSERSRLSGYGSTSTDNSNHTYGNYKYSTATGNSRSSLL